MMVQNISLQPALVGLAVPKRIDASNDLRRCQQNFHKGSGLLRTLNRGISYSAKVVQNGALVVHARACRKSFTVKKIIEDFHEYLKPNDVEFFSSQAENGDLITENLLGQLQLNLNPQQISRNNCQTIKQALISNTIELDIQSVIEIWLGKIVSIEYYHLPKIVLGLACIDFSNYKDISYPTPFGSKAPALSEEMALIRKQYGLVYLGYALGTLFITQPTKVLKKPYAVQKAILDRNIRILNQNDFSYHLVFDRPLQFVFDNQSHTVDMRIIFHIFRYQFQENDEIGSKTYINLDSFYPVGSLSKITFRKWQNDLKSKNLKDHQIKFDFAKQLFQNESIFDKLRELNWTEDEIKQRLDLPSLIFDKAFTRPII
jgi:hypothetical protein